MFAEITIKPSQTFSSFKFGSTRNFVFSLKSPKVVVNGICKVDKLINWGFLGISILSPFFLKKGILILFNLLN